MLLKRTLTLFACLIIWFPVAANAQGGSLSVTSVPEGAHVVMKGEATVSGVTPVHFRHTLVGSYNITISKYGYETYKTKVFLDPSKQMELDITLSRKTRIKAAARSLLIPGWGQRYGDKKFRGKFYTILAAASVAGYYFSDQNFDREFDRFKALEAKYDEIRTTGTQQQLEAIMPLLTKQQEKAYDAENDRRFAIGSVIAVWSLSVLDALFFFPEEKGSFTVKGLSVTPQADMKNISVNLSYEF